MGNNSILIGYYICKYRKCPEYLRNISEGILSASDCLCTHEPQITCCHGWKPNGDKKEYIESIALSDEQYITMSNEIGALFDKELFLGDGRFLDYKDAIYFRKKYFKGSDYYLISVVTDKKYIDLLGDDFPIADKNLMQEMNKQIGCDIIGWDISGFHSFLCNSLHEKYSSLSFNKYCLVSGEYSIVEKISSEIQGQGEPVDWIPVELFLCE